MTFKDFFKTTEALVVLTGLFLTVILGKFWAIVTGVTYVLLNVPSAWSWIMSKFQK
ncbi:MAG: hypothetical protein HRU26_05735 [Psychroserpens sp.]|nr:hypothetical protein [Psychroserpens sp.]